MNILIVKLYPLSEIINALPTIHLVKKHYQSKVTLVVHEFFSDLVDILEDVDYKVLYPENELKSINRKNFRNCLLYTSPSPRDRIRSRMPSSA